MSPNVNICIVWGPTPTWSPTTDFITKVSAHLEQITLFEPLLCWDFLLLLSIEELYGACWYQVLDNKFEESLYPSMYLCPWVHVSIHLTWWQVSQLSRHLASPSGPHTQPRVDQSQTRPGPSQPITAQDWCPAVTEHWPAIVMRWRKDPAKVSRDLNAVFVTATEIFTPC